MSKHKLVYIEWEDATSRSGWHLNEEVDDWIKGRGWFVNHVGWVIRETKKYIVLAGSQVEKDGHGDEQWGNLQKIPKTWIRKRKILKT